MADENPLLQTDFMRSQPTAPSKPTPRVEQPGGSDNPLLQTDFMRSQPQAAPGESAPSVRPNQSGIVDKALFLTSGREPAPDMAWSDVGSQAIQNAPKSAVEFGKAIVQPFLAPIETAKAVGDIGSGLYSKAQGALGVKQDPAEKAKAEASADAVGQFYKDRYGSLSGLKRALAEDPVGVAADAATVLTGGGSLAARLPGTLGKVGEAARTVGSAIDPLNAVMKAPAVATKVAMTPVNWFLSGTSGASTKSLNEALKAGMHNNPVFWEHMSGRASADDAVQAVRAAVSQVAKQRSDEYMRGMGSVASNTPIPYDKVDRALQDAASVGISRGRIVNQEAADMYSRLQKVVDDWRNHPNTRHNLSDFDELKRAVRDAGYANSMPGSPARKVAEDVANAVKDSIPDKRYAQIMEQYGDASRQLNDLYRDLVGGKSTAASLRKILKAQDTKHKSDLMRRVSEIDPNIPYMVAGQELHPLFSSGLRGQVMSAISGAGVIGMLHPAPILGMAASMPRVVGTGEYALGKVVGAPGRLHDRAPLVGQGLFQAGRAEEVLQQASGGRVQRASGGRLNAPSKADMIIAQVDKARRELQRETGGLLNHDDSTIVKALKVANERI